MLVRLKASVSVSSGRHLHTYLVHRLIGHAFGMAPLPASLGIIKVAVSFKYCIVYPLLYSYSSHRLRLSTVL